MFGLLDFTAPWPQRHDVTVVNLELRCNRCGAKILFMQDQLAVSNGAVPFEQQICVQPTPAIKVRRRCVGCECELSETLDAYWGRSLYHAEYCNNCRYKRKLD